jgi:hypothetical protein
MMPAAMMGIGQRAGAESQAKKQGSNVTEFHDFFIL